MQITSSRDNESASAAGFNEAECREEKENLMGKKFKRPIRILKYTP